MCSAGLGRSSGVCNAHLICGGRGKLNTRTDDKRAWRQRAAQKGGLLGRGHHTVAARPASQGGEPENLIFDRWSKPDFWKIGVAETCDDRKSEDPEVGIWLGSRNGGLQHGRTGRCVNCDHRDAKPAGSLDGTGYGVGYLVKLAVEKDMLAFRDEISNDLRPGPSEKLKPNLVVICVRTEPLYQRNRFGRRLEIKRDDDG